MIKRIKKFILFICFCLLATYTFSKVFNTLFPFKLVSKYFNLEKLHTFENLVALVAWIIFGWILTFSFVKLFRYLFLKNNKSPVELVSDSAQAEKIINLFNYKCKSRKSLMITGEWGYGKTFFYKKSLRSELKKMQRKILEVSCFGINSAENLVNQILNGVFFLEIFSIFSNYIRQFFSCSLNFKRGLIPKNLVIVIDDFERASVTKDSKFYIELLGLINYLLFEKGCHVIILCDEDKICAQGQDRAEYEEFRKKIIEKYKFVQTTEILSNILEVSFKDGCHLSSNIKNNCLKLVSALKDIRVAISAYIDWKMITDRLINDLEASPNEKEAFIQEYFSGECSDKIKAAFIKNYQLEDEYLAYRQGYEFAQYRQSIETPIPEITSSHLKILGAVKLDEHDRCLVETGLYLSDTSIAYLKDENSLFDKIWLELSFVEWLFQRLQISMKLAIDDSVDNNLMQIKDGFIEIFNRIVLISLEQSNDYCKNIMWAVFLLYKVFEYKYSLNIDDKEDRNIVSKIEGYLSIDKIKFALKNIIDMKMCPDSWSHSLINDKLKVDLQLFKAILKGYKKEEKPKSSLAS